MSDRDAVREAVDVLWDIILRADNDQAVVMLLCSGRQWQDDANCYAHVLHCEFMGTSRNAVEVYLRRRVSEAVHGDRSLLFWQRSRHSIFDAGRPLLVGLWPISASVALMISPTEIRFDSPDLHPILHTRTA
jgi:hypothetical protein